MNYPAVFRVIGILLVIEGLFMMPSLGISWWYGQSDSKAFLDAILFSMVIGFLLVRIQVPNKSLKVREGLAIVVMGWLVFSVIGAFPLVWSGSVPTMIDAFFESVSGFTTTGATVIKDVEILPKGILFWRSFTHWIGGMGILVFTVAILPAFGIGGFQMFKAEMPGPLSNKIAPRITSTARILYITYISMTLLEIILLVAAGMNLFEASVLTFGTVGSGGFSTSNNSVGSYSPAVHWIIGTFMLLASCHFSMYFVLLKGRWRTVLADPELRFFAFVVLLSILIITFNISPPDFSNFGATLHHSTFQVFSIISSTGYATTDYDQWPTLSKAVLLLLMFIGGCAGSTAGGIKSIRILLMLKLVQAEIVKLFHPRAVVQIRVARKSVPISTMSTTTAFFFSYILIFALGTLLLSLENLDLFSAISASAAALGNTGSGFGAVGPLKNYAAFSDFGKLVLTSLMFLGRLEIFTVLALFTRQNWMRD